MWQLLYVDWLGFSHMFYTKNGIDKPFFTKIICLKTVLFVMCWKYFAHTSNVLNFKSVIYSEKS